MNKYTNGINLVVEEQDEQVKLEVENFQQITTSDYNELKNKPSINNVELVGNKSSEELDLVNLTEYKAKQLEQDNSIKKNAENLTNYKIDVSKEQKAQDTKITKNSTDIANLTTSLDNYKLTQQTRDNEQDKALEDYKQLIVKEQQAQDVKIKQNSTDISGVTTELDNYKQAMVKEQQAQNTKIAQNSTSIQDLTTNIDNYKIDVAKDQERQDKALNDYKLVVEEKDKQQDQNIQANALELIKKVNKDDYEKAELAQNALINANKQAIETTSSTLETYKQETAKGFQDERELSTQEYNEIKELANTKAVIDDFNLSSKTTFSSFESAERFTCEKTYQGKNVEIKPIEDYPMKVIANIEAVKRDDGYYVGWENVDVTQDNGGTHKVYNQQLNRACFDGNYDFAKGKLTITSLANDINGSEDVWEEIKLTNGRKHQFVLKNYITNASNDLTKQFCNNYNVPVQAPVLDFNGVWIKDNALYIGGQIADNYSTLQEWKNFLLTNPFQIVYGLQTPVIENYEPQIIKAQTGVNMLYANSGNISVTSHIMPLCDGEGGKIDGITLNGVLQIPDIDKIVNLEVITDGQVDVKIAQAISKIPTLQFEIVEMLPEIGEKGKIYLVPIKARKDNNGYTEWAWINEKWELLGSTEIDLSQLVKYTDIVEVEGSSSNKVLSQKYVTEQLKLRVTAQALTKMLESYATLENIQNLVTREDVINDNVVQDSSAYSSKKMEEILKNAKYSPLIVNVQKKGESDYTADYNDNDIRNYVNADGIVKLRYENQEFAFDKYLSGVGAIFNYNEINKDLAQRIKIVVKFDKSVEVTTEKLLKVAEADNAITLNGVSASDYVLNVDIADVTKEPIENVINANTQLIRGWYKTTEATSNLPFEEPIANKVGFLRVLECNHDTRKVLQVFYSMPLQCIYLRVVENVNVGNWLLIPNETNVNSIIDGKGFGLSKDYLRLDGTSLMTGDIKLTPPSHIYKTDNRHDLILSGGINFEYGATIQLNGYDTSENSGGFDIYAMSKQRKKSHLVGISTGNNQGTLKWCDKELSTKEYVDTSIQQAILDSWKGVY